MKSVEQLLGFAESDRTVRAYAYLTVAFNTRADVSDVLDCLLPFVSAVITRDDRNRPIELAEVVDGLAEFGLKVPVYAVQQLLGRLGNRGLLEWNALAKAFLPTTALAERAAKAPPLKLEDSFDQLEEQLARFGQKLGLAKPPVSKTWSDALIEFLRSESAREAIKAARIREALVGDPTEIESFVIARFVQDSTENSPQAFADVTNVFTGILIEDFISNVQEIGSPGSYRGLNIFYDTAVLLRALGTSGSLLQTATLEMHTTLQGLGCNTYYFDPTSAEVQNILDTLEGQYSRGKEIYGETSDALHYGEITIGEIRDISGTFETRLGALNIFPFPYNYSSKRSEDYFQIDENAFSEALKSEAIRNERGYSGQNAANDAHVVALTLRLRRGRPARSLGKSHYLFISKNSTLQRVAKKFVSEHVEEYDNSSVPCVLTMSQVTTVAWVASTRTLEHHKVSRELLAACYAAVQPSEAWAEEFARVFGQFRTENPEFLADRAHSMIFLNTARSAARDESLNQPVLLRKANMADLFRQAAAAEEEVTRRHQEALAAQRAEAEDAKRLALAEADRNVAARAALTFERVEEQANAKFSRQRNVIRAASVLVAIAPLATIVLLFAIGSVGYLALTIAALTSLLAAAAAMDRPGAWLSRMIQGRIGHALEQQLRGVGLYDLAERLDIEWKDGVATVSRGTPED